MSNIFICKFCGLQQVPTNGSSSLDKIDTGLASFGGLLQHSVQTTVCNNETCGLATVDVMYGKIGWQNRGVYANALREQLDKEGHFNNEPSLSIRSLPVYVPEPIREDYYEAHAIKNLSPKASATLVRRCLQGMLRDFAAITKRTLFQEIGELKSQVDAGNAPKGVHEDTIEALDGIRKLGNIGAHMEQDIGMIIPIDPDEVDLLLSVTDMLIDEWYIARHDREKRIAKIKATVDAKEALRST